MIVNDKKGRKWKKAGCGVFEGYIYILLLSIKIVSRDPTDL
jgi:hypothetical protein